MAYGRLAVDAKRFPARGAARHAPSGGRDAARRVVGRSHGVGVARGLPRADRLGHGEERPLVRGDGRRAEDLVGDCLPQPAPERAGGEPGRPGSRADRHPAQHFLPADGLEPFLEACRTAIPRSRQDLLNVTLRFVAEDRTSLLAYARGPRVAAVMLFSQKTTRVDDEDMAVLTRRLIDAALDAGGSLPALPPARPARSGRARVPARGGIREPQASLRSRAAVPEHDVESVPGRDHGTRRGSSPPSTPCCSPSSRA